MNTTRTIRAFQRTFEQAFRSHHAPYRIPQAHAIRAFSTPALQQYIPSPPIRHQTRLHSNSAPEPEVEPSMRPAKPLTDRSDTSPDTAAQIAARKALSPAYQLHFTCKQCLHRSAHTVSKQAYHFGTCVINCPSCKVQHLISDHLKIFSDTKMTMEDIAREHGEKLRKGRLGVDGDVEFYDDAAEEKVLEEEMRRRGKSEEVVQTGEGNKGVQ